MAALLNVTILTAASAFIVYGAVHRLHHPEAVSGLIVAWVAGVGILGNGISAWLLHRDSKHSLNIRSAFLHMMGDFLFSVAVFINGMVLIYKPWYWLDPLLSLLIVLFILKNCWSIMIKSTAVLMNATPKSIDLQKIRDYLVNIPEVISAHYLHAWNVSASSVAFSCHVVVPDQQISRTEKLAQKIRHDLMHLFQIDHPILQFETTECGNGSLLCELSCGDNGEITMNRSAERKPSEIKLLHLQRIFSLLARLILGGIFIYAGYDKILHPAAFAKAVYNYQILPDGLINLTTIILPWLELVLGSFLIIGIWLPGTAVMSNLLLLTFTGALFFNMARGLDIGCGCFSTTAESAINLWTVLRDISFLIPAVYLFYVTFFSMNNPALNQGDDESPYNLNPRKENDR